MRLPLVLFVSLVLSTGAAAQPSPPAVGSVPPLPAIGLPLPEIGLPLAHMGLPEVPAQSRSDRVQRHLRRTPVYVLAPYAWPLVLTPAAIEKADASNGTNSRPLRALNTGRLVLRMEPAVESQAFVDGVYVWTSDAPGIEGEGAVELAPGRHVLQIMSPGYNPIQVGISVTAGRSVSYRARMTPIGADAAPTAAAPTSSGATVPSFVIPGCYVGNVPPEEVLLGCDPSRAVVVKP